MIRPLGSRVLIKPEEADAVTAGGIHLPPSAQKHQNRGRVVKTGPGSRHEDGTLVPLDVQEGDLVLYGKFCGVEIDLSGEKYLILQESDIVGVLEG